MEHNRTDRELTLPSERALPDAVADALIHDFFENGFDAAAQPEKNADALSGRFQQFSYAFVFVRLKDDSGVPQAVRSDSALRRRLDDATERILELTAPVYSCFSCRVDGFRALLLVLREAFTALPSEAQYAQLEAFFLQQQQSVSDALGYGIQIVCSRIEQRLASLPEAFLMTLFTVDYAFAIYPQKDVVSFYTATQQIPDTSPLGLKPEWERQYFDAVFDHNFNKAKGLLFSLMQSELSNPATALSIRNRLHSRLDCTLSILGIPVNESLPVPVRLHQIAEEMISSKTVLEMNDCIEQFFDGLSAYFRTVPVSMDQKLDMILQYINANYADCTLSAGKLSGMLHISQSYLSRMFKHKTGIKLIDYIHLTRIRQARALIQQTDDSLAEIAQTVGYAGEWSLGRAFKRYENITPGSLRSKSG